MILGVDVSDDAVRTVAIDSEGTILHQDHRPLTADAIASSIRAVATDRVVALGVAVHAWLDRSLRQNALASASDFAREPRLVTRGSAFALAEQWRGAAAGTGHVVALVADEYVDAGIVIDGRIFGGAHGLAGAAGWLALNPVERDDYRRFGCLDAEVSGPGIVQRLVWRVKAGDPSKAVDRAGGDLSALTTGDVFAAARHGDGVAVGVVRDTARYLGMAVANLVVALDPEIVVIGGLVVDAADLILEPCRAEAMRRLPPEMASKLEVVAGAVGDDAVALGAARAAILAE